MENFTEKHFFCVYTKEVMEECYPFTCGKDDEERKERIVHPRHLDTRLMFCDLLPNELRLTQTKDKLVFRASTC